MPVPGHASVSRATLSCGMDTVAGGEEYLAQALERWTDVQRLQRELDASIAAILELQSDPVAYDAELSHLIVTARKLDEQFRALLAVARDLRTTINPEASPESDSGH